MGRITTVAFAAALLNSVAATMKSDCTTDRQMVVKFSISSVPGHSVGTKKKLLYHYGVNAKDRPHSAGKADITICHAEFPTISRDNTCTIIDSDTTALPAKVCDSNQYCDSDGKCQDLKKSDADVCYDTTLNEYTAFCDPSSRCNKHNGKCKLIAPKCDGNTGYKVAYIYDFSSWAVTANNATPVNETGEVVIADACPNESPSGSSCEKLTALSTWSADDICPSDNPVCLSGGCTGWLTMTQPCAANHWTSPLGLCPPGSACLGPASSKRHCTLVGDDILPDPCGDNPTNATYISMNKQGGAYYVGNTIDDRLHGDNVSFRSICPVNAPTKSGNGNCTPMSTGWGASDAPNVCSNDEYCNASGKCVEMNDTGKMCESATTYGEMCSKTHTCIGTAGSWKTCELHTTTSPQPVTTKAETTNSGTTNSGTTNSGTTNSGTTKSGTTNSETTKSATTKSATKNSTTSSGIGAIVASSSLASVFFLTTVTAAAF